MTGTKNGAPQTGTSTTTATSPLNKGSHDEIPFRIVRPHFANPDTHPYDEIEWEYRTAEVKNHKTGEFLFKQDGVFFPEHFSQLATNIVASKYFYGSVEDGNGNPKEGKREYSLRQLINRVVDTIADAGVEQGLLDAESAHHFGRELKWLLVNQYGAFNSPVWFNVGLGFKYGLTDRGDKHIFGWSPERRNDQGTTKLRDEGVYPVDPYERPQAGACQPYGSLVSTPDGMVPVGRLVEEGAVGREVYDAAGTTRIQAARHNGRKEVFRIRLRSGNSVEATADHLVFVSKAKGRVGRFVRVDSIREGDRMSLHVHRPSRTGSPLNAGEAALAGWLLSDGHVRQNDYATSSSLVVEFETINDAERGWVRRHNGLVFPGVAYNEIAEETEGNTDYIRFRAYGERFRPFIEKYALLGRGKQARVPALLFDADLDAVRAFLRSVFECDGYVVIRSGKSKRIGYQRISAEFVAGVQKLLLRLGIFSRVTRKVDPRENRHDGYCLSIGNQSELETFRREVGFISPRKQGLLDAAIALGGKRIGDVQYDEVVAVEPVGVEEVYDIQTESGEYLSGNVRVHNCTITAPTARNSRAGQDRAAVARPECTRPNATEESSAETTRGVRGWRIGGRMSGS